MSQEADAFEWGFDEAGLEEPDQNDSPGRSDQLSTISSSESWGFDDAVHATEKKQDDFPPGRWGDKEEGDDEGSHLVSVPLSIQHRQHWPESSAADDAWGMPKALKARDILKALSGSTRDALNALGIRDILDIEAGRFPNYGDNMFHLLACPRVHTTAYHRQPWSERLEVTRKVVKILVAGGVDINARNCLSITPLLMAVSLPVHTRSYMIMDESALDIWAQGPTIIALLEHGADPTIYSHGDTVLTRWLKIGLRVTPEREGFDQILRLILARLPNINARDYPINSGYGTFLHHLVAQEDDPDYVRLVLRKLHEIKLHCPLNVNALDSEGNTPILTLFTRKSARLQTRLQDNVLGIAQTLLDMGAQIDFVSAKGLSAFTAVAGSWGGSDEDCSYNVEQLVKLEQYVTKTPGHSALIKTAPLSFIARALQRGHTKTAAILLRYGMKDRLGLEEVTHGDPSWLANDLFKSPEADWIAAAVFKQLARVQELGGSRTSPMTPYPPRSISALAFCSLGRTRLFAWNLSFALFYPMFALARSDDGLVACKDYRGRLDADTRADYSAAETTDYWGRDSLGTGSGDQLLKDFDRLARTSCAEWLIVRSRPSWRRAHSCPGTEGQWRRNILGERRGPISEYYWYSRQDLRRVAWRRDSTPDLNGTLAAEAPLDKLRLYVFRGDGGNIRSTKYLKENDTFYRPADVWVGGGSNSGLTQLIPDGLDARLQELEMWQSTGDLFWSDPDGSINRARQAIQSTAAAGHIHRTSWLASLAHKLTTRYEQDKNNTDLDEAIDAGRQAVKSTPESQPHRARWLKRLAIMLTMRYTHDEHGRVSDLNEAIDIYRQLTSTTARFASSSAMAGNLEGLALNLARRFKHTGDTKDLDESIHLGRRLFKHLCDAEVLSDFDQDRVLRNLGMWLSWRYPGVFNLKNEDNAILCARAFLDILATWRDRRRRQASGESYWGHDAISQEPIVSPFFSPSSALHFAPVDEIHSRRMGLARGERSQPTLQKQMLAVYDR
ncbi:hypothetical protein BDW60DRAFT_201103 [Aspergillus nidulans var. acristatus]